MEMQAETIPEDIREQAQAIALNYYTGGNLHNWLFAEVARALMERDKAATERAARICEGDFDSEMRSYGDYFAAAIRSQP